MKTLIIPCAGRSTRFPNMKPKWMLTHPDGKLMIEKAISGLPLKKFDRIIITIVKEHSVKHEATVILKQALSKIENKKVEILEIDDFTSCQAETVYKTLLLKKVKGEFVVKDSDNYVYVKNYTRPDFVVGLDISIFNKEISRLSAKSFLVINNQKIVTDIIEKKICSENICLGVYGFSEPKVFIDAYHFLMSNHSKGEIYLSHVISYLIGTHKKIYSYVEAADFEDWGTLQDWRNVQNRHATYFVDIDGVILNNRGKYGKENWSNSLHVIDENVKTIKDLSDNGAQIILTTSRKESDLTMVKKMLNEKGIKIHSYVTGCHHSVRILINDFAPTNPYPSCKAINIPRNGAIFPFLEK